MHVRRVALIFDDRPRPDTTGIYCRAALGELAEVEYFRPDRLHEIRPGRFDLHLAIDDGFDWPIPDELRPMAYWAIDTHMDFERRLGRARKFDLTFAAQRDGAGRLRDSGVERVEWLPLACDPRIHRRREVAKRHDVCFVGHLAPSLRADLVALLMQNVPTAYVGRAFFDAMAEIYSASRVVFNRSVRNDINMRVFEALACGSMLLTNDLAENGQADLFRDGEHLATYRDADDMLDRLKYYLEHEEARERIAASGRAEVLAKHTYRHRMEHVLRAAEALPTTIAMRPVAGSADDVRHSESDAMPPAPPRADESSRRMPVSSKSRLGSVIIPCWNQREFTRQCIAALARHTRDPWELIVVDNGSTDGTGAFLEGVHAAAPFPVQVITNPSNQGFPAACNQGLKAARGDFLVLLNNDAVVTDGWLEQLIALVESDPKIGLAGPMSNYATPPQLVEHTPYRNLDEMHRFAARWRAEHRGQWMTTAKLSGFCLLMKRAVLDAVGGLDEQFGLGFFDDDDLAARAGKAGFELAVAHDLFIHHFGSRTFVGAGIDSEALLSENERRFAAKWGLPEGQGRKVALRPWEGKAVPAATSARPAKVSLTMIVKNEESNLPACLSSAADLFDEIIVVDTGSTDRTAEIARSFGARVFDFIWVNDFAAARNAALARATGDFAFWLDADDVIEPSERPGLKALLDGLDPESEAACVVRCSCDPDKEGGGGQTVVDHIRLFPLREDVRWTYRVHEQILPALRRAGVPVRWTEVTVRHTGYNDNQVRGRKLARDEAILLEELADRPADPFVLFNLGSIAIERQDAVAALDYLTRSLAGSAPADSITRKLYALIARAHQTLEQPREALDVCKRGLTLYPDDAELLFRQAVVHRNTGSPAEAEALWRRILTIRRPEQFSSLDMGIYGHLTRRNLAVLAQQRGDHAGASSLWEAVLAECPGDSDALAALRQLAARPTVAWLVAGSKTHLVPARGPGDFDPYVPLATDWVTALGARVVVALGVGAGVAARALVAGVRMTEGHVWGVDPLDRHGIVDPRYTPLAVDPGEVADRWDKIDLLHIDTDPHTEEQTSRWFSLFAGRCRAIALHDTHHPAFGVGAAVRAFVASGDWQVYEYWGNPSGWTVLTRPGEPCPAGEAAS